MRMVTKLMLAAELSRRAQWYCGNYCKPGYNARGFSREMTVLFMLSYLFLIISNVVLDLARGLNVIWLGSFRLSSTRTQ